MINKRLYLKKDSLFIPIIILLAYSILVFFQINLPNFNVAEYDYHWNLSRTASSILNLKYSLEYFEFPFFDYFKNYSHYSLYQVIPTLNPIYLLIFIFELKDVIFIQMIVENFLGMFGVYLILKRKTNNYYLPLIFAIFYGSIGFNLSSIKFLIKDYYYLPLFIYFTISFFKEQKSYLFYYLVFISLASNWSSILIYPTISFFLSLIFLYNKRYFFFKSVIFSILIFFSLSFLWFPLGLEIFSDSSLSSLSSQQIFSDFIISIFENFKYLLASGIDGFLHPYNGTIGPLYVSSILYTYIFLSYFKLNKENKKIYLAFAFLNIIFLLYFFIFSEFLYPQKIRQHLTIIPPLTIIFFSYYYLDQIKKIKLNLIYLPIIIDFFIFIILSFYEKPNFFIQEPNKINFFIFFHEKISYYFPILHLIFFLNLFKYKDKINFNHFIVMIFAIFVLLSAQNSWLNKFENRAVKVTPKYEKIYKALSKCIYEDKDNSGIILFNSKKRLNDEFIMMTNLNKVFNFSVIPEYEETNSAIYSYIHDQIEKGKGIKNIDNGIENISKYKRSSNLGYFTIDNISKDQLEFLNRVGVNKIVSEKKIKIDSNHLYSKCSLANKIYYIYIFEKFSPKVFLSNFKMNSKIKNSIFYSKNNFKKIDINKIRNNINFNLHEEDLKFKYLYIMSQRKNFHNAYIDNKKINFSDTHGIFSKFIVIDLEKYKNKNIKIDIVYETKLLFFAILSFIIYSFILLKRIYK